jgi:putative FmdB family regulatory protein
MPIYAYRCDACGHAKDVLQKVSDPLLTVCPSCGADSFKKQVTAAGFQLKGSGWYVTDFRNGSSTGAPADKAAGDAKPSAAGEGQGVAPAAKDAAVGSDAGSAKPAPAVAGTPAPSSAAGGSASPPTSSST